MEQKNLVNVQELAIILNVPKSWIYQRTRLGKEAIPHVKKGKYGRFNSEEVIEIYRKNQTD